MARLVEVPDDVAQERTFKLVPVEPAAVSVGRGINDIPRQLGLTARYALEGPAEAAQIVTEPIANLMRMGGIKTKPLGQVASGFADYIGLPKPEGANERVISDASKLVAGSMLPMKLGQAAGGALSGLAASPLSQGTAAAGAGLAGGSSREAGGNQIMQAGASALGGIAGGVIPGLAQSAGNAVVGGIKSMMPTNQAAIDAKITMILQNQGIDFSQLSRQAQNALRQDLAKSINIGSDLKPEAVARLADFRAVGATPTRGMVTLDPVQLTREKNLSKIGANSSDGSLQGLPLIENQNNAKLIQNLNNAGAAQGDQFAAGSGAINRILSADQAAKNNVNSLYEAARNTAGGDIPLDRKAFIDNIYSELAKSNKLAFLPENVGSMIDQISAGQIVRNGQKFDVPFTANTLDNLMTTIATAQRGTSDGNIKAALSAVRKGIDSSPANPVKMEFGGNQVVSSAGGEFLKNQDAQAGIYLDQLNKARQAAAQRFGWQESSKPVEAALSGMEPDKFIEKFVIRGNVADAQALRNELGDNMTAPIKNAILEYVKRQAIGGASDEVGKVSQSAFNKSLNSIGDRKLSLFFSPEELAQLKANARVSSYMQVQPVGSAVNNSNSGALGVAKVYDAIRGGLGRVPGVGPVGAGLLDVTIGQPTKNAAMWLNTREAQNILPGLLQQQEKPSLMRGLIGPGFAAGGLLAAPRLNE